MLQISAAINPGNSGGPLINIFGEIVGINSRIYSTNRDSPGFQGIGFAIPSNAAFKTMTDILDRGHPVRGFLGMAMENLDPMTRRELGIEENFGVRVVAVGSDSPAAEAGLKQDDVIMRYQGEKVTSMRRLIDKIQQSKVGSEISLEIWRDGSEHLLTATIGEAEKFLSRLQKEMGKQEGDAQAILDTIGIDVREPTFSEKGKGLRGLVITRIQSHSTLRGKLLTGDTIRAINGRLVKDAQSFYRRLAASVSTRNTELTIQRGDSEIQVTISPIQGK